jgi:hypothetical protein
MAVDQLSQLQRSQLQLSQLLQVQLLSLTKKIIVMSRDVNYKGNLNRTGRLCTVGLLFKAALSNKGKYYFGTNLANLNW